MWASQTGRLYDKLSDLVALSAVERRQVAKQVGMLTGHANRFAMNKADQRV